jgi:hypothetical protein
LYYHFWFFGCRKGEEDPAISLKSRKSRLAAEWAMRSGYVAYTVSLTDPPLRYNETWSFDGSGFELNTTEAGPPVTYVGKYFLNLNVRKDGTFDFDEFLLGRTLACRGTWCFAKGKGEDKNKETVVFTISETQRGSTLDGMFNQHMSAFRYSLVKLTKGEIKIRSVGYRLLAEKNQSISMINDYTFSSHED